MLLMEWFFKFIAVFKNILSPSTLLTARVKKAVDDVEEAMKGAGRLKRGVTKTTMVDHLKNKAADLIKKLDNQQG